jgi:O-antigen ligase
MLAIRRRIALYLFCAVVAVAPLPFGSVDEMVIAFWVVLLGVVAILAIPFKPSKPQTIFLLLASIIVLAWGLIFHEQTSDHPWLAQDLVDPVWRQASRLLDVPLPQYVSVVRSQPFFAAGAQMVAFLSVLSGFLLGIDRAFAKSVVRTVAWSGAFYAIYAILSFIWDPGMLLWRNKTEYTTVLTGTFVNRNTAAIYFGACAIVWLLLFFKSIFGPTLRISAETHLSSLLLRDMSRRAMLSLAMFVLLMSATFMTGSRAGSVLFLLTGAGLCLFSLQKKGSGRKAVLGLIAALVLAGAILLKIAGGGVDARIGSEGLIDTARLSVYRAVLRLIVDHPWLGTGLGTFPWIFPSYRPSDISAWGIWDRAHSTLLEIAAEQGVPFAFLVLGAFLIIFLTMIHGARTRRSRKIYPVAGLMIALLSAAHSLIDFSLQIPGLTIVVFALVGVGVAQSVAARDAAPAFGVSPKKIAKIAGGSS